MSKTLTLLSLLVISFTLTACDPQPPVEEGIVDNGGTQEIEITPIPMDEATPTPEMRTEPIAGDQVATIKTNLGDIKLFLYSDLAPETSKNFSTLAQEGKYDGVIFHRVINDFMLQTGDFENHNGTGGYTYKGVGTQLRDEFGAGLSHLKGAVSMANAGPNTGGSQFFIVQKEDGTDWLDGHHAIFGFVYEGLDLVDQIAVVETASADKPVEDITIETIEIGTF